MEVQADPVLKKIIEELQQDPDSHPSYTIENGKLHYKGRLVLSSTSVWIPKLLQEFHTTPTGGHSGIFKTHRRLAQSIFWLGMKKSVTDFVAACHTCQRNKY